MGLDLPGVALVTGAGGALGLAIVLQFAQDGVAQIAGIDVSVAGLAETAKVVQTKFPSVEFLQLTADISDEVQVSTAYERVVAAFGRIDYAINNAAISAPIAPTSEASVADFDRLQKINLRGTWLCEREALRQMAKQAAAPSIGPSGRVPSKGSIVTVSSLLGIRAMPGNGPYTISKHAIIGMVKTDALDYATKGIRVNAVAPGFIETPLITPAIRQALRPQIEATPMQRLADPQEIADVVVYLASDRASYITGAVISVDGGYSAQ